MKWVSSNVSGKCLNFLTSKTNLTPTKISWRVTVVNIQVINTRTACNNDTKTCPPGRLVFFFFANSFCLGISEKIFHDNVNDPLIWISFLNLINMALETAGYCIETPLSEQLGIKHPIILAGMGKISSPHLAASVSNAGGLGCFGGVNFSPRILKIALKKLKSELKSADLPFGVDLLLPQIGGSARKTNIDYTKGKLSQLIDIIIESGAKLFVSAVGAVPKFAVKKLHKHNIFVMNMVGHPKHAIKALANGVDIICAQGTEAGGHTGAIATTVLLPKIVDICKNYKSPLTGKII